jgi:hypothetical protein
MELKGSAGATMLLRSRHEDGNDRQAKTENARGRSTQRALKSERQKNQPDEQACRGDRRIPEPHR